ncbi:hypothetical protein T265_07874 [Opisthorchis viverrini]|uniref:Uncharacterized protein n=1 Tax=Opisthorchis viverrini TaxID=6198 RepID=A0A075AA51_OPIVI|nr:hypothetical protein T265_07874 [Opisthorchis viverrini]KER24444.1 hypothetical protein T265_07874 [Opisthorchis viverrini]
MCGVHKEMLRTPVDKKLLLFEKYTHLKINLVFARDSAEPLDYDIRQLNVLHTGRLMFQLTRYSKSHNRRSPRVSVNPMSHLNPNRTKLANYTHLQTNLVLRDSTATQLNLSFVTFSGN